MCWPPPPCHPQTVTSTSNMPHWLGSKNIAPLGGLWDQLNPPTFSTYQGTFWEVKWWVSGKKRIQFYGGGGGLQLWKQPNFGELRSAWLIYICLITVQKDALPVLFFSFFSEFFSSIRGLWTGYTWKYEGKGFRTSGLKRGVACHQGFHGIIALGFQQNEGTEPLTVMYTTT